MNREDWKLLYGEFKPDTRMKALVERLEQYYSDTEHLDNKAAMRHWREFSQWAKDYDFTSIEVNKAKQQANQKISTKNERRLEATK